jgi:two-component sensor histidine kinase
LTLPLHPHSTESRKAPLSELVRTILSPYDAGHISACGPDVEVGPKASTSFALLLHEFATNSVKYGALSEAGGHLEIKWQIGEDLVLDWLESGCSSVEPPPDDKQGFGGVLVTATISGLGGTIRRDWHETGVNIRVTVPSNRIAH